MKDQYSGNNNFQYQIKHDNQKQCLNMNGCQCSICRLNTNKKLTESSQIEKQNNCLEQFLKQFPLNFPLHINPTTIYKNENGLSIHYSNGNKIQNKQFIFKAKATKLLTNFPIAQNIHIFGNNFGKILPKYEAASYIKKLQQYTQANIIKKTGDKPQIIEQNPEGSSLSRQKNYQRQRRSVMNRSGSNSTSFFRSFLINKSSRVLYLQSYYSQEVPIKIYYKRQQVDKKLDSIILEYLNDEQERFQLQKIYEINEEFWQWVYNQYGQQIFIYFITEFYCRVYQFKSKNKIIQGIFYWVLQKPKSQFGDHINVIQQLGKHQMALEAQYFIAKVKKLNFKIRLLNVKNFNIDYFQNIKSFQEQYQQLILQRLKTQPSKQSRSLFNDSNKKKYIYQSRLNQIQGKVRSLFLVEQNQVLNKVQKQKEFDGKQDSKQVSPFVDAQHGSITVHSSNPQ